MSEPIVFEIEKDWDDARACNEMGFTPEEYEAWVLIGEVARRLLGLEELHSNWTTELYPHIHHLQSFVLQRPAYRTYREITGYRP